MQCASSEIEQGADGTSRTFTRLMAEQLPGISLEDQILLAGARVYLGQDEISVIQRLLHDPTLIDGQCLVEKGRYNGLIPILFQVLKRCGDSKVPQDILEGLKGHVRMMSHFNQCLFQEMVTLTQEFQTAGVNILSYKGPSLALAAYGDLSLRQPGDLDFLVAFASFEQASQWFQSRGYITAEEHAWVKCFRHPSTKIETDLHHNVAGLYLPFQLDFNGVWSRRGQTMVAGVSLDRLCSEDLLMLLCVQFAKDAHDNQRKLIKACDIAAVINRSVLDWSLILEIAHQSKGDRPLKLGLSIVEMLFGVELPSVMRAYAHSDWVVEQYRRCICKEFFIARSVHRSILGLVWRALFLFQNPFLEWRYDQKLVKLFIHSLVNKARRRWPHLSRRKPETDKTPPLSNYAIKSNDARS